MSAIQSVSGSDLQMLMQAQQQLAVSRNDTTRQANNVAQLRSSATEEATESDTERTSEAGGGLAQRSRSRIN
jgi:hypothetical protein